MNPGEENKESGESDPDDQKRNELEEEIVLAHVGIAGMTQKEQDELFERALRDTRLGR